MAQMARRYELDTMADYIVWTNENYTNARAGEIIISACGAYIDYDSYMLAFDSYSIRLHNAKTKSYQTFNLLDDDDAGVIYQRIWDAMK